MKYIVIILYFALTGCSDFGIKWEEGPYAIYWTDIAANTELGYSLGEGAYIGRVGPRVVAVGSNEKYIAVKSCDRNLCSYFIVDRAKDHKFAEPDEVVIGPLSEAEYQRKMSNSDLPKVNINIP